MFGKKFLAVAAIACAVAAAEVGCSQPSTPDSLALSVPSAAFSGPVPPFTGPWAAEFADAYRSTTSEHVHKILSKGSISDADYADVSSGYVKCMADRGFTVTFTGPDGQSTVTGNGDARAAANSCNGDVAVIASLRHEISRNPQHLEENTIVAACLVKRKLAPPSYSARQYAANLKSQKFPFSTGNPDFRSCTNDPLGLSSGH
jgi:hypothetical protein